MLQQALRQKGLLLGAIQIINDTFWAYFLHPPTIEM